MEITAKEIERQATRVDEEAAIFVKSCNDVIKRLMDMAKIVESDDTNLAAKINQYANEYISLQTNLSKKFTNLATIMHGYASKTLANEQEIAEAVNTAAEEMSEVSSSIFE